MFAFAKSLSEPERWVYGLLFTAAIIWSGHWLAQRLNHGLALVRENRTRRLAAATTFNATALDLFSGLYPVPSDWPSEGNAVDRKLQSIFPALQSAVATFREALPRRKQALFDSAWSIYLHGSDGIDMGHYYQYMGYSSPDRVIPDSKETFKANVARLLSYAKET